MKVRLILVAVAVAPDAIRKPARRLSDANHRRDGDGQKSDLKNVFQHGILSMKWGKPPLFNLVRALSQRGTPVKIDPLGLSI